MKIICHSTQSGIEFDADLEFDDSVRFSLRIKFDGNEFVESGTDLIDALRKLRLNFLEPLQIVPLLNGCRRDFVASRMQRQSTGGKVGYIFVMGSASQKADVVLTFDPAARDTVSFVLEQDANYKIWLESLKNEKN
ncbi:hypothetical protein ACO0LM_27870 [Undibacterium sp. Di26W]|uniref:hypothetical protein n=1 Tax=Undibacterium sp. Di26W TaxID=3413035 RepID=UPI003BF3F94C